jgi:hypothetical protein
MWGEKGILCTLTCFHRFTIDEYNGAKLADITRFVPDERQLYKLTANGML